MPSSAEANASKGTRASQVMGATRPRDLEVVRSGRVAFAPLHAAMLDDQSARAEGRLALDRLRLFSPEPVVTLGSGADRSALLLSDEEFAARGVAVVPVDRGGEATFHGPGQRVGYLNLLLDETERDLHRLLRTVEGALIDALAEFGIAGVRVDGHTGVWVDGRKIAAIGMSVRRWVTGHGFALCVEDEPEPFGWIVPCGIRDCPMTSIERETGVAPDRDALDALLARTIADRLERSTP